MAILHRAELRPSKVELIELWAPSRPWFPQGAGTLTSVGSFRFDDPAGEVGVETLLIRAGDGPVLQVPLTYRGAPLPQGDAALVGTMEHSVLGPRWVYDGTGDPVYLATLATAAMTGGAQAELVLQDGDRQVRREPTALVRGSGTPGTPVPAIPTSAGALVRRDEDGLTVISTGGVILAVERHPGSPARRAGAATDAREHAELTGTWAGQDTPVRLATITVL